MKKIETNVKYIGFEFAPSYCFHVFFAKCSFRCAQIQNQRKYHWFWYSFEHTENEFSRISYAHPQLNRNQRKYHWFEISIIALFWFFSNNWLSERFWMPKPLCTKNKSKPYKNVSVLIYFFERFFHQNCVPQKIAFWSTALNPMVFLLVSISFAHQNHKLPKTLPKMCTEILIGFDLFHGFYAGLASFVNAKPMRFALVSI